MDPTFDAWRCTATVSSPICGVLFDFSEEDEKDREGLVILDARHYGAPATATASHAHVRLYVP